jgi:hypothetical protein
MIECRRAPAASVCALSANFTFAPCR